MIDPAVSRLDVPAKYELCGAFLFSVVVVLIEEELVVVDDELVEEEEDDDDVITLQSEFNPKSNYQ